METFSNSIFVYWNPSFSARIFSSSFSLDSLLLEGVEGWATLNMIYYFNIPSFNHSHFGGRPSVVWSTTRVPGVWHLWGTPPSSCHIQELLVMKTINNLKKCLIYWPNLVRNFPFCKRVEEKGTQRFSFNKVLHFDLVCASILTPLSRVLRMLTLSWGAQP